MYVYLFNCYNRNHYIRNDVFVLTDIDPTMLGMNQWKELTWTCNSFVCMFLINYVHVYVYAGMYRTHSDHHRPLLR